MQFRQFPPWAPLAKSVRVIWSLSGDPSAPGDLPQPVPPDGCIEVVFNFADPVERLAAGAPSRAQPTGLIVGEIDRPLCVRWTGRVDLFGVRFAPGQRADFLEVNSPAEVFDQSLAFDNVATGELRRGLAPLFDAETLADRVQLVQAALLRCVGRRRLPGGSAPLVAPALALLEGSDGAVRMEPLAERLGLSVRQLERRFRAHTGATPKDFAQVFRFQKVLRALTGGLPHWASIAADSGYFDQAHLIRDFKRYTTLTPRAYLGAHHPLADRLVGGAAP